MGMRVNVIQTPPVEIALRTLGDEDRRSVWAWFDHLHNWENDLFVRKRSQRLHSTDNIYVLKASNDIRIFFRLEKDRIVILDIARKESILSSGHISVTGQ
jgi:hypothetical protein